MIKKLISELSKFAKRQICSTVRIPLSHIECGDLQTLSDEEYAETLANLEKSLAQLKIKRRHKVR